MLPTTFFFRLDALINRVTLKQKKDTTKSPRVGSLPVVDRGGCRQAWANSTSVISSIKTARLINAIQNFGGSGHEPDSSVGRSLLSEIVCGDVLAMHARSMER